MKKNIVITQIKGATPKEGELLIDKIARVLNTGTGIEITQGVLYSEKYEPSMDIRTDKWDVALSAIKGFEKGKNMTKEISNDLREEAIQEPTEK